MVSRHPPEVVGGASVQWADTVCSVGGYNQTSGQAEDRVRCWNPLGIGDQWVQVILVRPRSTFVEVNDMLQVSQMGTRRHMPGAVVMDGKLFVAGGYDPKTHKYENHFMRCVKHAECRFLSSVEVLDDVTKQWYSLPPLSHPRAGLGLVGVGGRLFAVGGWADHQYSR